MQKITDNNDVMDSALHVDDAVPAAERLTGLADQIEGVGDLAVSSGCLWARTISVVGVTEPGK